MVTVRDVTLRGRRLTPPDWHVRSAISPCSTAFGTRLWSLLLCYEGVAAFRFPRGRYWAQQFRWGLVAGVGHVPPTVVGDEWPLGSRGTVVAPSATLFPRDTLSAVDIQRARVFWSCIRIRRNDGRSQSFDVLAPRQLRAYADKIEAAFPRVARRTGWWPAA